MVLRPGRSQRCPRAVEYVAGPFAEDGRRLAFYVLGVEEMDAPAACARALSQHLAVHHGVRTAFIGRPTLDVDIVGEVKRPRSKRHRHDRFGYRGCQFIQRGCRRPDGRCSHLRDQRYRCGVVEKPAFVMDRRRRHTGFDQVDPSAIRDLVASRGGNRHGPAEMMSDTHTHDVSQDGKSPYSNPAGGGAHEPALASRRQRKRYFGAGRSPVPYVPVGSGLGSRLFAPTFKREATRCAAPTWDRCGWPGELG